MKTRENARQKSDIFFITITIVVITAMGPLPSQIAELSLSLL